MQKPDAHVAAPVVGGSASEVAPQKHDCVEEVNAQLVAHNTRLMGVISTTPDVERIALATVKADDKNRKKPALMFATFCPFCGVKLAA